MTMQAPTPLDGETGQSSAQGEAAVLVPLAGRLVYPPDDRVLRFLREGWFEYREIAAISRLLRASDGFVDVGAHCGLYSKIAQTRLGSDGTIMAVEPNPSLHPFLSKNLGISHVVSDEPVKAARTTLVNAAVATSDGTAVLHARSDGWSAYSTLHSARDQHGEQSVEVVTRTLESLIPDVAPDGQIFVKLDTEGLEYDIVRQAETFLRHRDDVHLLIEFDEGNLAHAKHSTADLAGLLTDAGYVLAELDTASFRLRPCEKKGAIWGLNLIATRNLGLLNARLETAKATIAEETEDFLRRGEAAERIYLRSEELDRTLARSALMIATTAKARAAIAGEATADAETARVDVSYGLAQSGELQDRLADEIGRLAGTARWFAGELSKKTSECVEATKSVAEARQEQAELAASAARERKTWIEGSARLHARVAEAARLIDEARIDQATFIAETARQAKPRLGQASEVAFLARAQELEQRIKLALARAASSLAVGLREFSDAAPEISGEAAAKARSLVPQEKVSGVDRLLANEIRRVSAKIDMIARSRWLRLGSRLGADSSRQLDLVSSLLSQLNEKLDAQ